MKIKIYNQRFWTFGGWFTWVSIGVAVVGAGTSLYGANKQTAANNKAIDANQVAQANQNNSAWANYLMTRGIAPTSGVTAGVLPGPGESTAVNTRLPIWATVSQPVNRGSFTGVPRLVKIGAGAPATGGTVQPTAISMPMPRGSGGGGNPGGPGGVGGLGYGFAANNPTTYGGNWWDDTRIPTTQSLRN